MVHIADSGAGGNSGLYLAQVLMRLAEELLGLAVVGGGLMFLCQSLGVWDKVEVVKAFLTFAGELDGVHQGDFIVAHGTLGIDERIMVE